MMTNGLGWQALRRAFSDLANSRSSQGDSSWKSRGIHHLPNIGIRTRLILTQIQRGQALRPSCPAVYRTPYT